MSRNNDPQRYGTVAQALHWAIVALLIVQFTLAALADELPRGAEKLQLVTQHKSFGITILALAIVRIVWRLLNRPPPLPPMPHWQRVAAQCSHWGMYVLLLVMPLTGWMYSSSADRAVKWFGVYQLPDLVGPSKPLNDLMHELHEALATALLVLVTVHVAAALKHQFWNRDGLLWRMLPSSRRS
ncbi:MAG TPA: cytochrome b [Gammaproteobacteria bacterium]